MSRLRTEATLDVKMPGDHSDRPALARNELRRHARWTRLLEELRDRARATRCSLELRDPRDHAAWLVAPTLARWVREDAARGAFALRTIVPGRYLNGDRYRPAHTHVKVRHASAALFTTQLYFAGDPYNAGDPWFDATRALQLAPDHGGFRASPRIDLPG